MFNDVQSREGCFEKQEEIHCVSTNRYEGLLGAAIIVYSQKRQRDIWLSNYAIGIRRCARGSFLPRV